MNGGLGTKVYSSVLEVNVGNLGSEPVNLFCMIEIFWIKVDRQVPGNSIRDYYTVISWCDVSM